MENEQSVPHPRQSTTEHLLCDRVKPRKTQAKSSGSPNEQVGLFLGTFDSLLHCIATSRPHYSDAARHVLLHVSATFNHHFDAARTERSNLQRHSYNLNERYCIALLLYTG